MNLQDIFDQLTYGELSNLSIGGSETGGISTANAPKIISNINMAVAKLYIKFSLLEATEEITISEQIREYYITPLVLTGVFNSKGEALPINDPSKTNSVYTPSWNTLQIPDSLDEPILYISYFTSPTKIALDADPMITEVILPDILLEPLLAYVASRVHTSLGTAEGIQEGLTQMNRFELLCVQLKSANVLNLTTQTTNIKMETRGWL